MPKFIVKNQVDVKYVQATIVDAASEAEALKIGAREATNDAKKLFPSNGVLVTIETQEAVSIGSRMTIARRKGERGRPVRGDE
jgi:predicted homoserine dehydrogenase-like protein